MRMRHGSWILAGLALGCLMFGCKDAAKTGPDAPASAATQGAPASTAKAPASAAPGSAAPGSAAQVKPAGAGSAIAAAIAPRNPDAPGDVPALTAALSAEHTVGLLAAERPQQLVVQIDKTIAALPAEAKADMPPPLRDPAARQQLLGFDPTTAAGWRSAGLDPDGGMGVVFDARLEAPLIVLKVADRAAMLATLNRLGAKASVGAEADGITPVTIAGKTGLTGVRGGYTFILAPDRAQANRAAFAEILKVDAPLSKSAVLQRSFSDNIRNLWLSGWLNGGALARFITRKEPGLAQIARFYAERFEAVAFVMGQTGGTARVLAGAKGVTALRQMFAPAGAVPDFASRLDRSQALVRVDLNFTDFFDGVLALIPEQMAQPRSMVLMAKNGIPMAIGASFEQLGKALTGHIAAGVNPQGQPPIPVLMLGVRDTKEADTLLQGMTSMLKTVHKAPITEGKIAGRDGYLVPEGPTQLGLVRVESMIYAGTVADITKALKAKGDLPLAISAKVNGPAMMGFFIDFDSILASMQKTMPAKEFETMSALAKTGWAGMLTNGFLGSRWMVDGRGLKLGDGASMMAFIGVGAAVAIPAFMKYIRRSKSVEASMNLRKLFDSSVVYYEDEHANPDGTIKPKHFPASTPLTPATTACKDGKSVKHMPTPGLWDHPTWKALNFEIADPFYYQYQYVSDGKSFTARVLGDLDCDGTLSTFERVGQIDGQGNVNGGAGVFKKNELE